MAKPIAKQAASTQAIDPNAPKKIQRITKAQKEFTLDRFKSDVKDAVKNDGYEKYKLKIRHEPHTHRYASKDMDGKTHEYCDRVLGHTHKIDMVEHEDGTVSITCSPAIQLTKVQTANGMKVVEKKIRFAHDFYIDPETGKETPSKWVEDNHTHEWEFIDTAQVSNAKIKEAQAEMAEQMKKDGFHGGAISGGPSAPAPIEL